MASRKKNVQKGHKEVNQILKYLQDEVARITVQASKMEAEEARIGRELDRCREEILKMKNYIERATESGNNGDVDVYVAKKRNLEEKEKALKSTCDRILNRNTKIKQIQNQFLLQRDELRNRKDSIDMKIEKARIQEIINQLNSEKFSSMEEKANRMMDEAEAMAELNELEKGILD